jgi:phenazine biosynthesis protein phzE
VMKVTAGATLVRDSVPAYEVAETQAKAGGILSAVGLVPGASGTPSDIADRTQDEDVLIALNSRNRRLAKFWLTDQAGAPPAPSLAGRTIAILHGEDDFVNMLAHVFAVLGMGSRVIRHETLLEDGGADGVFDGVDLVVVGPGPGDPREHDHPKIAAYRKAIDGLLASDKPFLAVCLGHQVLCDRLGIALDYKDIVFQGTQSSVDIDGRQERVGFYNTFVARLGEGDLPDGLRVESDPATGDIHMLAGPNFRGVQFHAESILTENGFALLRQLLLELLG